jgi:hypothetical protein
VETSGGLDFFMTPEEQRIAIAEACGISPTRYRFWYNGHDNHRPFRGGFKTRAQADAARSEYLQWGCGEVEEHKDLSLLPNYPNDLNAMHAAVKTLIFSKRKAYRQHLQRIVCPGVVVAMEECVDATAAQRAEAFLRALNLWISPIDNGGKIRE